MRIAHGRAEIYIDRGDHDKNKWIFDNLFQQKAAIKKAFGGDLVWERLEHRRACRIKSEAEGNIFEREQWPQMIEFMTDAMVQIEKAFKEPLSKINQELKTQ
jgi:CRISPR/Cas system CSM-associated protein Csm3 (group 7 of RAMP superfamily)